MVISLSDPDLYTHLVRYLKCGECLIMPCDTIYGLVGIAPESEAKLREIKEREMIPFVQLIACKEEVERYATQRIPDRFLAYWPGPVSYVVRSQGGGSVALRVPADPLLRRLMIDLGTSLYSTSVNISGEKTLTTISSITATFGGKVALIVDGGDLQGYQPSTIIDLTKRPYRLLRQGKVHVPL